MEDSPSRTTDELFTGVMASIEEIRGCYNEGRNRNPDLAGKAEVGFEVLASGETDAVEVRSSTLDDKAVEACIVRLVAAVRFCWVAGLRDRVWDGRRYAPRARGRHWRRRFNDVVRQRGRSDGRNRCLPSPRIARSGAPRKGFRARTPWSVGNWTCANTPVSDDT